MFEQAYEFCDQLFSISTRNPLKDNSLDSPMTVSQIHEFISAILSIVLSHHFQKEDIKNVVDGTLVDFSIVRDTMYKYSKKAEERFFSNPCYAYLFIKFATCEQGQEYI